MDTDTLDGHRRQTLFTQWFVNVNVDIKLAMWILVLLLVEAVTQQVFVCRAAEHQHQTPDGSLLNSMLLVAS